MTVMRCYLTDVGNIMASVSDIVTAVGSIVPRR